MKAFNDTDDIRSNTTAALKAIPQNKFQNCSEGWTRRWHRCIASQGEYSEGDHGGIQQWGMQHFYRHEFANFIVRPRTSVLKPFFHTFQHSLKSHNCNFLFLSSFHTFQHSLKSHNCNFLFLSSWISLCFRNGFISEWARNLSSSSNTLGLKNHSFVVP